MLAVVVIKNYAQEKTNTVKYYPVAHHDSEIHAEQNGNLERHAVSKIEDCVRCQKLTMPETRLNILRLWSYVAGHYRRGQEADRATNQQSIHHVRP